MAIRDNNTQFVSHKKSKLKVDGKPKLPSALDMVEGEIAINFAEGVETLSIKNESGDVVTFSSDNYYSEQKLGSAFTGANSAVTVTDYIEEDEEIISAALNDLETRKLDVSAYTPVVVDQVLDSSTSASTNPVSSKAVYDAVTDNELVWTNAFVTLSGTVSAHTANTSIHVTSADKEAWNAKVDKSEFDALVGSGFTVSSITDVIIENEFITSTALNDLNERIDELDLGNEVEVNSGDTPTGDTIELWIDESLEPLEIEIDQIIDSGTSASTNAVSTSAVYGFVTAYSPSITVDQVIDSGTSASTGAVSTHAVFDYITRDELVISTSLNDLNVRVNDLSGQSETVAAALVDFHKQSETVAAALVDLNKQSETVAAALVDFNKQGKTVAAALVDLDNRVGIVSAVTVSSNLTNVTCPSSMTGATNHGAQATIIYENSGSSDDYTITVSTSYKTPDGEQIELTCPMNGYCEVSYININGTIYARGV